MKITTLIFGILIILALALSSAACSSVSTEPDEVALHYSGGSFSSKNFKDCVDASDRVWDGPGDKHYVYPKGQRTYSFTGAEGSERDPMAVTTGSQEVLIPGFVTFTLNTDCETLRAFHEKVGKKYGAYAGGGGWDDFLNDYIAVPLSATLNEAAGAIETPEGQSADQNWYALYTKADTQKQFEEYVKEHLPAEIENTLGNDFITVNAVSISKPDISADLKKSLAAKEKARLDNDAQEERNAIARTKYDSMKDCQKIMSEQSCLTIYLSEQGDIPFYPVPQGGAINVDPSR